MTRFCPVKTIISPQKFPTSRPAMVADVENVPTGARFGVSDGENVPARTRNRVSDDENVPARVRFRVSDGQRPCSAASSGFSARGAQAWEGRFAQNHSKSYLKSLDFVMAGRFSF